LEPGGQYPLSACKSHNLAKSRSFVHPAVWSSPHTFRLLPDSPPPLKLRRKTSPLILHLCPISMSLLHPLLSVYPTPPPTCLTVCGVTGCLSPYIFTVPSPPSPPSCAPENIFSPITITTVSNEPYPPPHFRLCRHVPISFFQYCLWGLGLGLCLGLGPNLNPNPNPTLTLSYP
jgi:hypothetical protein